MIGEVAPGDSIPAPLDMIFDSTCASLQSGRENCDPVITEQAAQILDAGCPAQASEAPRSLDRPH